jgi:hypothetical protein
MLCSERQVGQLNLWVEGLNSNLRHSEQNEW